MDWARELDKHYIPTCYANRFKLGCSGGSLHAVRSDGRAIKSVEAIIGIIGDKEALAAGFVKRQSLFEESNCTEDSAFYRTLPRRS
jgi:hypothetical protein